MAGLPAGSQTLVAETPEIPAIPQTVVQEDKKPDIAVSQQEVAQTANEVREVEDEQLVANDVYAPGAIAARRAAVAQGETEKKYRLAPIKWGGQVFATVGWRRLHQLGTSWLPTRPGTVGMSQPVDIAGSYHQEGVMVRAETYILKPWIATVAGRLGVMSGQQRNLRSQERQHENGLTGGGKVSLFSMSRFPFIMSFNVTDSRLDDDLTEQYLRQYDTRGKSLNLEQRYRPLTGPALYSLSYDYSHTVNQGVTSYKSGAQTIFGYSESTNASSTWGGTYTTKLGEELDQPLDLNVSHDNRSGLLSGASGVSGSSTSSDNIRVSHTYMPEESLLTLRNRASYTQGKTEGTRVAGSWSRNLTVGTNGSWQPEEWDNPLVVAGGAQFFNVQSGSVGRSSKTRSLSANATATYNKWANLSLVAGGTIALTDVNGISNFATMQFGRAVYQPRGIRWGKSADYQWGSTAGFLNQTSAKGASNTSAYAGANHSLFLPYSFKLFGNYRTALSSVIGQSLTVNADRVNGVSETLISTGTLTLRPVKYKTRLAGGGYSGPVKARASGGASLLNSVRITASDTRTFGKHPLHSQTLGIAASLGGGLNTQGGLNSSLYGVTTDISVQASRQLNGGSSLGATGGVGWNWGWVHRFGYNYKYLKSKIFGVRGLSYGLDFKANATPRLGASAQRRVSLANRSDLVDTTNNSGVAEFYGYGFSLGQALRYRIGSNEVLLTATLSDDYGINTASLFLRFRAWRNFGN